MLRLAIIGTGGYAHELLKRIWTIPETIALVAAVADPDPACPGNRQCRARGVQLFDDVASMLTALRGKCDVIYVPTSIHTHGRLAAQCLRAGFDVFLEKPPVATIQELDALIAVQKETGHQVAVAFQHLYSEINQRLQKCILSGRIGSVKRVCAMAAWPRPEAYFARNEWAGRLRVDDAWVLDGTLNNPLAHLLANALYLASSEAGGLAGPHVVQAELYRANRIESEDTSSVRIKTVNGVEVLFHATLSSRCEMPQRIQADPVVTIVEGTSGRIEYRDFDRAWLTDAAGDVQEMADNCEQRVHMLQSMAHAFIAGKPYLVTPEFCRPFTLAVNAAFESSGQVHSIPQHHLDIVDGPAGKQLVIKDIEAVLECGHQTGRLFSQMDVPWSQPSQPFALDGYGQYPRTRNTAAPPGQGAPRLTKPRRSTLHPR